MTTGRANNGWHTSLFWLLLITLAWSPLPFGSETDWARALMQTGLFVTMCGWLLGFALGKVQLTPACVRAWPVHGLFLAVIAWLWIQQFPWPAEWVERFSPKIYNHYLQASLALDRPLPDSLPLSLDGWATYISLLQTLAYYCAFTLVLLIVKDRRQLKVLAWTLALSGTFQAVYGTLNVFSGLEYGFFSEKTKFQGVATGTYLNRNHLAGLLEMTTAVAVGLLISQLSNRRSSSWKDALVNLAQVLMSQKVLLRSALIIMVIGLVVTRSRMGNTAFFTSLLLTGLLYVLLKRKLTRGMIFLMGSMLVIDILIVSNWFGLEKVVARLEGTTAVKEGRDEVSLAMTEIIHSYPLTGTGGGSFYTALPAFNNGSWRGYYNHGHNDLLQFPVEIGLPAFALLIVIVLLSLWQAIQALRTRHSKLATGTAFAAIMGTLALIIHSSVDYNLQIPANGLFFITLLALTWISRWLPGQGRSTSKTPVRSFKPLPALAVALLPAYLAIHSLDLFRADILDTQTTQYLSFWKKRAAQTDFQLQDNNLNTALSGATQSVALSPKAPDYYANLAEVYDWQVYSARKNRMQPEQAAIAAGLEAYRTAVLLRPAWPDSWAEMAAAKVRARELDQEFFNTLSQASRLGPWEKDVMTLVARVGLRTYTRLPEQQKLAVDRNTERMLEKYKTLIVSVAKRTNQMDYLCKLNNQQVSASLCPASDINKN